MSDVRLPSTRDVRVARLLVMRVHVRFKEESMSLKSKRIRYGVPLAIALCAALTAARPSAESTIRRVLLISIDGMHTVDYDNCVAAGTCPNLALLGRTGVSYKHTSASEPSDSFPGLTAIVTGGTPKSTGVYYDVAYDRVLAPPAETTGNDLTGAPGLCTEGHVIGTRTEYEEGVDINQSQLGGGFSYTNPLDGDYRSIKPSRLPRDPFAHCAPVYPWNFIRTNTVYGVLHAQKLRTAWSDKHAVYAAVSGPTGTTTPDNVDDYYSPDVNSDIKPLPITTASADDCTKPDPFGGDWTGSFQNIRCYDQLKVNAVLHWIDGKTHLGDHTVTVPTLFGMNFQAVSVGQKLIENGVKGGYADAVGTPTSNLLAEIEFVDAAIGEMVAELKVQGLYDSTAIIITAKHGQSPIDPDRFFPIPGHAPLNNGTPPSGLLGPSFLPDSEINQIGPTEDDISLLWLTDSGQTNAAVDILQNNAEAAGIDTIFAGRSLERMFDRPGLPANGGDPRTPDIVVQPKVGVVYTGSLKKQAEHGGFAPQDVEVMVLVANPHIKSKTLGTPVETRQVAPTILSLLGLDPNSLDAVRAEGTGVLPGIQFK
jgi:hypothetical protein